MFDQMIARPILMAAFCGLLVACGAPIITDTQVLGRSNDFIVVVAGQGETYASLAEQYLGGAAQAWRIEDANNGDRIRAGKEVVIPRSDSNRIGVFGDGYQVVPILSYHRFGDGKGRLSVSRAQFERQMQFLERHGYRPVSLHDVAAFLRAEKALPKKSVALTIDDGYQSVYKVAFPVLAKYKFPATVFIYTDYIGNGGLTWRQMKEMEQSGLISFQAHSKTHDDLTVRSPSEPLAHYKARLADEVQRPDRVLEKRMSGKVFGYAYPFGAVNRLVVDELKRHGYELGATVHRGSNPFFAFPYGLRRTMIYEADGMTEFAQALQTFEARTLR